MEKKNILMVGSSLEVKGGMTTVVEGFINNKFKEFNLYFIPTHVEKSKLMQMIFFTISVVKVLFYLIFKNVYVVHIHFSERGSFFRKNIILKISKFFNKKVVIHMHGAEFKEFFYESEKKRQNNIIEFLLEADKVLVLGDSWYKFVKSLNENINIEIMPNFVKCTENCVKFDGNKVNILFLAVLIKRKGIFDLIEAINNLIKNEELKGYDIKVNIAGSGIEEDEVKNKVKELGLDNYFDFKGWVNNNEKNNILIDSQIFVLPSYNEGLPVSILEAMSYGLPIISTNVGSIEDAVKNDKNGIIIDPGDINAIQNSISTLIKNKDLWLRYSNNSKKMVEEKYSKDKYFENLEKLYRML